MEVSFEYTIGDKVDCLVDTNCPMSGGHVRSLRIDFNGTKRALIRSLDEVGNIMNKWIRTEDLVKAAKP